MNCKSSALCLLACKEYLVSLLLANRDVVRRDLRSRLFLVLLKVSYVMPLQQLVEYFNDRLEQEHHSLVRPFNLQAGEVKGLFGPIQIGSRLLPIRQMHATHPIVGYRAQLCVDSGLNLNQQPTENGNIVEISHPMNSNDSIINFDRLSRTVHMLNYLPKTHLDELLFLDVDPRHVLSVKTDHGAYFEEIIIKCGLQTGRVVITLPLSREYLHFYPLLLKGLQNYQKRGYRLAVRLMNQGFDDKAIMALIARVGPDFVELSALFADQQRNERTLENLRKAKRLIDTLHARSILVDVDDLNAAEWVKLSGFELAQGSFVEKLAADSAMPPAVNSDTAVKVSRMAG